jgi:hypothetical protein
MKQAFSNAAVHKMHKICNIYAVVIINLGLLEVRTLDESLGELTGSREVKRCSLLWHEALYGFARVCCDVRSAFRRVVG